MSCTQTSARFSAISKQPLSYSFDILVQMLASEILEPSFISEVYDERGMACERVVVAHASFHDIINLLHHFLTDEYYTIAVHKLDTKVESTKSSVVQSAIWSARFKVSCHGSKYSCAVTPSAHTHAPQTDLEKYPEYSTRLLSSYEQTLCDACNRAGRIATIEVTLSGSPYDRKIMQVIQCVCECP